MNNWKTRLLTNWHLMRIVRLGLGMMMLVTGIQGHDWPIGLFSLFFLYQDVTDTGCCGAGQCYPPANSRMTRTTETTNIDYEEIK